MTVSFSTSPGSVITLGNGSSAFYSGSYTTVSTGSFLGSCLYSYLSPRCRLSLFLFLSFFLLSFGPSCERIRVSFFLSFFSSSLYSSLRSCIFGYLTSIPFTSFLSLASYFSCMRCFDGQFFFRYSIQRLTYFYCSSVCSLVGYFLDIFDSGGFCCGCCMYGLGIYIYYI